MTPKIHSVVLLSGGIDSYACAHFVGRRGQLVNAIFFQYGQSALIQERQSARRVARKLRLNFSIANLDLGKKFGKGEIVGRNAILALAALPRLDRPGQIAMGIHAGTPYYDCSKPFAERIDTLIQEYTNGTAKFFAPFLNWTKTQVIEYCRSQRLDLSLTYSCERGGKRPCGKCASCRDRVVHDVG